MRHFSRRAVTLVELLVVIAIIVVLVGMLMPVLGTAIEASHRNACAHNMSQIGKALQAYSTSSKTRDLFPPSSMWEQPQDIEVIHSNKLKANWVIQLLPHLDSEVVFKEFSNAPGSYINDNGRFHRDARKLVLSFMMCPSDSSFNRTFYNGAPFGQGEGWARGNYAANGGAGFLSIDGGPQCNSVIIDGVPSGCAALPDSPGWQSLLRGAMGAALQPSDGGLDRGNSVAKISDGLSYTIAIGEIRAGISELDPRGVWAMSGGPSSLWACTSVAGGDNGPNANGASDGDSFPQCQQVMTALGITPQDMHNLGMPCNPSASKSPHWQQTVRSNHPGGANIGMCDGSVSFLSDTVEIGSTPIQVLHTDRSNLQTFNLDQLSVWDRLILANDHQTISADKH